ncbi:hypothetical protein BDZ97DRAFT_1283722 [Flammula alnicola]|nr:hypothetical protein BDZ97DRAFT_1283722 [Flammula alnicola]
MDLAVHGMVLLTFTRASQYSILICKARDCLGIRRHVNEELDDMSFKRMLSPTCGIGGGIMYALSTSMKDSGGMTQQDINDWNFVLPNTVTGIYLFSFSVSSVSHFQKEKEKRKNESESSHHTSVHTPEFNDTHTASIFVVSSSRVQLNLKNPCYRDDSGLWWDLEKSPRTDQLALDFSALQHSRFCQWAIGYVVELKTTTPTSWAMKNTMGKSPPHRCLTSL